MYENQLFTVAIPLESMAGTATTNPEGESGSLYIVPAMRTWY